LLAISSGSGGRALPGALLLSLVSLACAEEAPPLDETRLATRVTIEGRVVLADGPGLSDLSRVSIDLGQGEGGVAPGPDGSFRFADLEPDLYRLVVTYAGSFTEGASGSEAWTVSSSNSQALEFSAFLLPNRFGVFYRQTTRLVRTGQVVAFDLCGQAIPVGDMALDDYTWAPELAVDPECPPFPESSFPEAQCLAPPCEDSY
jgi:hypothetical protein